MAFRRASSFRQRHPDQGAGERKRDGEVDGSDGLFHDRCVPDVAGVIQDGTVGAEDAAVGDVLQAHAGPGLTVGIQTLQVGLCTAVILEVGHDHVRVAAAQVLGDFVEVLTVPAALQEVQGCVGHIVAHDEGVGVIADLLEVVDLRRQHTENQLVLLAGGIGGVHRGAQQTFDISADLEELAHTPVMVVCAGAKSILDLGLTLEYLETHGVPVIGYGTEELPAFYTRKSGFKVDYRIDTPAELAKAFYVKQDMGLGGGMLVTNPIPEEYSMDHEVINKAIDEAVAEANRLGIHGKETTPFLLAKIKDITGGDSLASNIQLVYNNARLAAKTACELVALAKN